MKNLNLHIICNSTNSRLIAKVPSTNPSVGKQDWFYSAHEKIPRVDCFN